MRYAEETREEIQPDGSIVLRKVIVPMHGPADQEMHQEPFCGGVVVIQIWGDPAET